MLLDGEPPRRVLEGELDTPLKGLWIGLIGVEGWGKEIIVGCYLGFWDALTVAADVFDFVGGGLTEGVFGDFWTDANPVNTRWKLDASVGFDGDIVAGIVHGFEEFCIGLEGGFSTGEDDPVAVWSEMFGALDDFGSSEVGAAGELGVAIEAVGFPAALLVTAG